VTRAGRLAPVQRLANEDERSRARGLADAQAVLAAAQAKALELKRYHEVYVNSFQMQATQGRSVAALRDYQLFLSRLMEAVRQQEGAVARAKDALQASTQQWQNAARRSKTFDSVVQRWQGEERIAEDRKDQLQNDEQALRKRKDPI
jgi:flagellar protein FliJ